jgi:hypothetical protein
VVASNTAILIDKLGPEASTAPEKLEVALALMKAADLPGAKRLATEAEQQSTNALGKVYADHIIANIDFQIGDAAGGRALYRRMISLLQTPRTNWTLPRFGTSRRSTSSCIGSATSCPQPRAVRSQRNN